MKRNRFLIFSIAILVLLLGAIVLTACGHTHEVLKWKTITEPTCTTEGKQRGACVECGEVLEESIATVEDNHLWGAWQVTTVPTYDRAGKGEATRVCKENPEHKQVVTLPKLSSNGAGYKEFEIYKQATVVSEGRLSAVYESEYGDIAFLIDVPKKEFDEESVEDAVYLGSSNQALIRQGNGVVDIGYNSAGEHNFGAFYYEYGTDYVHVNDVGGKRETWVSVSSSGGYFGILSDALAIDEIIRFEATALDMGGYHYKVSRGGKDYYGAEGLLYNAYLLGKKNTNRDFKEGKTTSEVKDAKGETVINKNGETVYWFQYSYLNLPQYFCKVECNFMLSESGAIKYIVMYTNTYARTTAQDGDKTQDQFGTYDDPNTHETIGYLYPSVNPTYNEVIEYHQDLIADVPEEPERVNTEESFQVASFDVMYEGKIVSEEYDKDTTPDFMTGGGNNLITLSLTNILPTSANFESDPVTVYRVNANGIKIKLGSSPDYDAVWIVESGGKVTIRSRLAGEIKLAFVTKSGAERIATVYANYSAPQILYPRVNEYHDSGYVWKQSDNNLISTTIYVGQSLTMDAVISSAYTLYVDGSYTAKLTSGTDATLQQVEDEVRFVAKQAGEYVVEMHSTLKDTVFAKVTITVEPAPDVNALLVGDYTAKFKKFDATISFVVADADGKVYAKIKNENYVENSKDEEKKQKYKVLEFSDLTPGNKYAVVTTDKGTEVLSVSYNAESNKIECEHAKGASIGVTISFNEAYKLVLTNPTGFGSGREKAIMYGTVFEDDIESDDSNE